MRPDRICLATLELLSGIGEDVSREGLADTPARVARFWEEFLSPPPVKMTTFDAEGMDEMIVQHGIPFFSVCEHHLVPFFGTASVGYVPNQKIVGLSKLARAVQFKARALQNQERMTSQVAAMLSDALDPKGVAVVVKARHLCMEMRGVRAHDTWTVTSCLRGVFMSNQTCREEFLSLARK